MATQNICCGHFKKLSIMFESGFFIDEQSLCKFVNQNRFIEVVSITAAENAREGFHLFYYNRALKSGCCPENIQYNIQQLLEQIKDGRERFQVSSIFNKCVQSLARDVAPIQVVNGLVKVIDSLHDSLTDKILGK